MGMLKNQQNETKKAEKITKNRLSKVINQINFNSVKDKRGLSEDFKNILKEKIRETR
jgi:hypothetical protein